MMAPWLGAEYTSSIELKMLARLMERKLRTPGWTAMLRFTAGTKLASVTRTE